MNILFVCSRNEWRSRTAETIFKNIGLHKIRSAGTASSARIKISESDVQWASVLLIMEEKHKKKIIRLFPFSEAKYKVEVLGIMDDYRYMDKELIHVLRKSTDHYFKDVKE